MSPRSVPVILGVVVSLLVAGSTLVYLNAAKDRQWHDSHSMALDIAESLDYGYNDLKYKLRPEREASGQVLLVAVDDVSLKEIGRWPWSRELAATITQRLIDFGAKSVGFDISFSDTDSVHPAGDARLAETVGKNRERVVLGTFSSHLLNVLPYQDYCVNEAFLESGGKDLVKLNPSFVVDDEGEIFDDVPWGQLFSKLFPYIRQQTERSFLLESEQPDVGRLSRFQQNALRAKKEAALYDYCANWLASGDALLEANKQALAPLYEELLGPKPGMSRLSIDSKLRAFQRQVAGFPIPQYGEWEPNVAGAQTAALYTASFVVHLDVDGFARRYPLFYRSGNRLGTSYIPSLALQTYLAGAGYRADVKIGKRDGKKAIESFRIVDARGETEKVVHDLPVDEAGRLLINYYGPQHKIPSVSARELLNDSASALLLTKDPAWRRGGYAVRAERRKKSDIFKDKLVIVGVTAQALRDVRNSPLDVVHPGPEIQASVVSNLLDGRFLKPLPNATLVMPLAIFVIGFLCSLAASALGAARMAILFAATLAAAMIVDYWIFSRFDLSYSSIFVLFAIVAVFASIGLYKYFSEERKKEGIRRTFSKYVSPQVVDQLLADVDALKLGGKKQELTVFFSDIRGFSQFSEKMDSRELGQMLTEYLTPMTEIIFRNQGTLDKYMGDGVMAFFGAPIADGDHAYHACKCAMESLKHLDVIRGQFLQRGWPPIDVGIGLNTGEMSVGNMGSKITQSYTVVGDAVNLGSRIEGANKDYGTNILISEFTHERVKGRFVTRQIDFVRVRGKTEPVRIFELMAETGDLEAKARAASFHAALAAYTSREFETARSLFMEHVQKFASDRAAWLYVKRCEHFLFEPPDGDWDGVFESSVGRKKRAKMDR